MEAMNELHGFYILGCSQQLSPEAEIEEVIQERHSSHSYTGQSIRRDLREMVDGGFVSKIFIKSSIYPLIPQISLGNLSELSRSLGRYNNKRLMLISVLH